MRMSPEKDQPTHPSLYDRSGLRSHTIDLGAAGFRTFGNEFVLAVDASRIVCYVSSAAAIVERRIDPEILDRAILRAGLPPVATVAALTVAAQAALDNAGDPRGQAMPWMFVLNVDGSIHECWSCRAKVWPALVADLEASAWRASRRGQS